MVPARRAQRGRRLPPRGGRRQDGQPRRPRRRHVVHLQGLRPERLRRHGRDRRGDVHHGGALTAGNVTPITATLTGAIAGHAGPWYYKRAAPSGDDTCHAVAAGVRTVNLSGLTASTSYTYKAYYESGCADADEILSVSFTTGAPGARDSAKEILDVGVDVVGLWSDGVTAWLAQYYYLDQTAGVKAFDLATGRRDASKEFTLAAANGQPYGIWANAATFWIADRQDNRIYAYNRATGARDASKETPCTPKRQSIRHPVGRRDDVGDGRPGR